MNLFYKSISFKMLSYTLMISVTSWVMLKLYFKVVKKRRKTINPLKEKILIVEKLSDWEQIAFEFLKTCDRYKVIGFDCEWTDNKGPVSLLQMATADGMCILYRLCKFQQSNEHPETLIQLLANPKILKVGVNPSGDAAKLMQNNLLVSGHLDLGWLAFDVTRNNVRRYGLKGLAQQFLDVKLDKSFEVRCSNWDTDTLSSQQIEYAANDAHVAVRLFFNLLNRKLSYWEKMKLQFSDRTITFDDAHFFFSKYVNQPFNASKIQGMQQITNCRKSPPNLEKISKKPSLSIRKSPLYHNCILQAPDGQPLCTCATKKAQWYLDQSLADLVSEKPLVVRLRFEPCGRPSNQDCYYLQEKENICVVCGRSDLVVRKNVIPQEYKRHFPISMKDHRSHDVVLLCLACHQVSNQHDMVLKQQLALRCNAPLCAGSNTEVKVNYELKRVRSAARALCQDGIPEKRLQELQNILCEFYGVDIVTEGIISIASHMDFRTENVNYVQHGYQVVEMVKQEEGLQEFEQMWRQHFLVANSPKFMPKMWSVTHKQSGDTLNESLS